MKAPLRISTGGMLLPGRGWVETYAPLASACERHVRRAYEALRIGGLTVKVWMDMAIAIQDAHGREAIEAMYRLGGEAALDKIVGEHGSPIKPG